MNCKRSVVRAGLGRRAERPEGASELAGVLSVSEPGIPASSEGDREFRVGRRAERPQGASELAGVLSVSEGDKET